MHGGPGKFVFIVLAILFVIDIYAFKGLRHLASELNSLLKIGLTVFYWAVPVFIGVMTLVIMPKMSEITGGKEYYRLIYTFMGVMVLFYVPKLIFTAFELSNDVVSGVLYIFKRLNANTNVINIQVFRYSGAAIATFVFFFTFYGILHGRYHYKENNVTLEFPNLPENFDGIRIVHITDWHIGSFYGKPQRVRDVVNRINNLDPDLILFTGDLVNNLATEVDEFIPELKALQAKYGVYSILGNHDYGEYVQWPNEMSSMNNLKRLKEVQHEIGFKLLNNSSDVIRIGTDSITLVGVENWGLPPFPQHGDIDSALKAVAESQFKILLSHDPSHWDAEIKNKTDIDLTLSGHTHGMQFGIKLKNFKWSPVKLKYPRWAGLYTEQHQRLFVSVGIGYIGFPGRVGIRPEIAILKLVKKK